MLSLNLENGPEKGYIDFDKNNVSLSWDLSEQNTLLFLQASTLINNITVNVARAF